MIESIAFRTRAQQEEYLVKKSLLILLTAGLVMSLVPAHPHMRKSVTAKLGDSEVTIQYFTAPINMDHVGEVGVGDFRRGANLNIGGDLQAGDTTIAAGDYTVGCIRNGEKTWTMVLSPGKLGRGESPDKSQLINLDSHFSTDMGSVEHVTFDISPGSGSLSGRAAVVWRFGDHYLAGAIS